MSTDEQEGENRDDNKDREEDLAAKRTMKIA